MSVCWIIGPAAADSFENAFADSAAVIALGTVMPGGSSVPASTERVSVALPPATSLASVWISVAPGLIVMIAENEPSAATMAATSLTMTLSIAAPLSLGATVPVTVI